MLILISASLLIAEVHLQVTTALALGRLLMAGANGWGGGGGGGQRLKLSQAAKLSAGGLGSK